MSKGIFVTGTDTGIGKTLVSCALLNSFNHKGLCTTAMKPVASGAELRNGILVNSDALALQQAATETMPYDLINPYVFSPAIAPHLAAKQAGMTIDFNRIKDAYRQLADQADVTVVEGVGGWQVPLNESQTLADLVLALELPVILVVGLRLGCLNHALLTAESITRQGTRLIGWVANGIDGQFENMQENIDSLRQRIPAPLLGVQAYREQGMDAAGDMEDMELDPGWI